MPSPLGSLEPVDRRTIWPDEARDFTPWLAQEENLRRLSDALNLGGSVEPIYNAVGLVELAADKGASTLLMPVSARKKMLELPDELATRVNIVFYADARDALLKALQD